jgi:RNA polymerase sigma-70 factor (ECF subfamily)
MLNLSTLSSEESDHLTLSEVAPQGGTPACGGGGYAANPCGAPRPEESAAEQQQRKGRQTAVPDSIDDRWNRLMAAAQRGDDAAYERLMREVRVWLSRYFHRRLPADAADDATQEALLAVHVHKQSYQTSNPMRPWLKTIARFKWIDQLRSHVRSPDSLDDADVPVDDHGSAARASVLLDMLLAETKPAQEIVIRLVKLRGESVEDASRISGQSPSLVKVNIHRGLKRIGRALEPSEN